MLQFDTVPPLTETTSPAGFKDTNGDVYVVYKVDGNSKGDGSWTCGQSKKNPKPTPIMLQKLKSDWMTPDGDPKQILDRDGNDGPLIEAPSLNFKDGLYYLYFSSNCYSTKFYDTSYATATNVAGPYTKALKPDAPLLMTGNFGLFAPGGTDVSPDGAKIAFHADGNGKDSSSRPMWVASINEGNKKVTIS
jgi:beta-xylosidase